MANKFVYGIGKLILSDFADPTKKIGETNLQKFIVESSYSEEPVNAGNKMFPLISFKKEPNLKLSFENAVFTPELAKYLDGASIKTGTAVLPDLVEVAIPDDGELVLERAPIANSISIEGFEVATAETPTKGQFKVETPEKKIVFNKADAGKVVTVFYEFNSNAKTVEHSVSQDSLSTPFRATYIFDIVGEDNKVVQHGTIIIYKAQCTTGTKFDTSHLTPMVQSFEAEGRDPNRADKKLWSVYYEDVETII